jgi:hypothetical protein
VAIQDFLDRIRVRQGPSGTAGMWLFQTGPRADRAFLGMFDDHRVGLFGNTGAAWGLVMDTTTGNVGIGAQDPGFKLDVADRIRLRQGKSGTAGMWLFQNGPKADRAFVGMFDDNKMGLWGNTGAGWGVLMDTTTGNVGIGAQNPGFKLDVADRIRLRQGASGTAGLWLFQNGPNADRAFIGMVDDNNVGLWGNTGAGFGLVMDTTTGNVLVGPRTLLVGRLRIGGGVGTAVVAENSSLAATVNASNSGSGTAVIGAGVDGTGVFGVSTNGTGIIGSSRTGLAGFFAGDVRISGRLINSLSEFKIDHPLDPANRYLSHSVIESDELKNVYDGVVELDADGAAEIQLGGWCEAFNHRFRYQLTPIGGPAPDLHVAQEIAANRFRIAGGQAGMTVCWQVTGVRQDAYAQAHPLLVEEDKSADERGYYLHPDLYGQPAERSIEWVKDPEQMRLISERAHAARAQSDNGEVHADVQPAERK